MVWITEIPWHEMNVGDELTLLTAHPWAREMEMFLRRARYQWRHLPADMVLDDFLECPLAIHSTDFGIVEDVDVARTDEANDIVSRDFKVQIREPEDLEKIRMPVVTHDHATTEVIHDTMEGLFSDIMPVRLAGQTHIWCAPWDYLVRWWGVEEAMVDMIQRPEMVNAAVDRMVDAWMVELDQFVEQDLLSLDDRNIRIGSGGYGYTRRLPDPGSRLSSVSPADMWGCSNAQVFAGVSPDMHWEFALRHDLRWLERWGLTYYGCCEPLDRKIDLLRRIPNLRKISMSSWSDFESFIREVGADYVISYKPSPAIFAEEVCNRRKARATLTRVLDPRAGGATSRSSWRISPRFATIPAGSGTGPASPRRRSRGTPEGRPYRKAARAAPARAPTARPAPAVPSARRRAGAPPAPYSWARASAPSVSMASATCGDQTAALMRRQFLNLPVREKIGPGAVLMACFLAASYRRTESKGGGTSTQSTYPPFGRVTRVPSGKNFPTASDIAATCAA